MKSCPKCHLVYSDKGFFCKVCAGNPRSVSLEPVALADGDEGKAIRSIVFDETGWIRFLVFIGSCWIIAGMIQESPRGKEWISGVNAWLGVEESEQP